MKLDFLFPFAVALACSLVPVGCSLVPPPSETVDNVVQWHRWEAALTAQKPHLQPYAAVEVDVDFTGPNRETFRVPAFWDGDRGFRVRAALPSPGLWRWQTTCNDVSDTGLHGRKGEVRVTAYTGTNPLYRHGDLRVGSNRRHLTHADGTPFLWLGDTGWNAIWKSTLPEWRDYIDTRARQRFSIVQVLTTGVLPRRTAAHEQPDCGHPPFQPDGTPDPAYWRDLDAKLAHASDRGLFVMLTGLGTSQGNFAAQQGSPAFTRYVAARFAGDMVILSPSMDQRIDPLNEEVGARLRPLTTHLVTQHPGTHFPTAQRYHDASYTDFTGLQTGHHNGQLDRAYDAARAWTLELWRRPPVKPIINVEAMYDARGGNEGPAWREQDVRKLGWITWLSGAHGYTYGAGDIPPKVPHASGGVWRFHDDTSVYDHWSKAILWPSAAQMTHLRDFFAGFEWWRLEPAPDLVRNQAEDPQRKMIAARSAAGDLLVAYLPDNAEITLNLENIAAGVAGRWFNPVTGTGVALTEPLTRHSAVTLHRPAGWSDAVLLVTTKPHPSLP